MRTLSIKYADENELYSRTAIPSAIKISETSFDRYFRADDKFMSKAIKVGSRYLYHGSDINARIDELLQEDNIQLYG